MSRVEYKPKEVIENKLLAALEPGSPNVAIVVNLDELDLLIMAMNGNEWNCYEQNIAKRARQFREDLKKLRAGAFPEAK